MKHKSYVLTCANNCYSYRQDCGVVVGPQAEGQMGGTQQTLGWTSVDRKEEGALRVEKEMATLLLSLSLAALRLIPVL